MKGRTKRSHSHETVSVGRLAATSAVAPFFYCRSINAPFPSSFLTTFLTLLTKAVRGRCRQRHFVILGLQIDARALSQQLLQRGSIGAFELNLIQSSYPASTLMRRPELLISEGRNASLSVSSLAQVWSSAWWTFCVAKANIKGSLASWTLALARCSRAAGARACCCSSATRRCRGGDGRPRPQGG